MEINIKFYDFLTTSLHHNPKSLQLDKADICGENLLEEVSTVINKERSTLELYFRGQKIKTTKDFNLSSTGFKSGCTIQVLQKKEKEEEFICSDVDLQELKTSMGNLFVLLHTRQKKHANRKTIVNILEDDENLEPIIIAVPGLKDDKVALDILRNVDLFSLVVDPKNAEKIIEKNKALGSAIIVISQTLSVEVRDSLKTRVNQDNFVQPDWLIGGLEPEEMETGESSSQASSTQRTPPSNGFITSSQLAQALASAQSAGGMQFPSPNQSSPSSSLQSPQTQSSGSSGVQTGTPQNVLTPDVFSMAMQQALSQVSSTGESAAHQPASVSETVMEQGLEQLRAMGIHDEKASRDALIVARGNVEAAVNILFAAGMDDL